MKMVTSSYFSVIKSTEPREFHSSTYVLEGIMGNAVKAGSSYPYACGLLSHNPG